MTKLLDSHPNAVLPLKAAVAALLAWVVVKPLDGFIDDYQYYAPLGAVITVSPALPTAARSGLQAVLSIVAGGAIAIVAHALPLVQPAAIALAVAAGVACSLWRRLGSMGSWVPFVALFGLLLHTHHPWHYVAAYVVLAVVGALIGLLVGFLLPQVPTGPAVRAAALLSHQLAAALEELAEAIRTSVPLGEERREALRSALDDKSHELRSEVRRLGSSRRANWRARATAGHAECIERRARSLQRLSDDVANVLDIGDATTFWADEVSDGRRPQSRLKSALVEALCEAAVSLRHGSRSSPTHDRPDSAVLARLRDAVATDADRLGDRPWLAVVGIAAGLEHVADGDAHRQAQVSRRSG